MNKIIKQLQKQFIAHAVEDSPFEACGVVIKTGMKYKYIRCRNILGRDAFQCHPEDCYKASEQGEIVAVFHSHTNGNNSFTEADKAFCNSSTYPYILYVLPAGIFHYLEPITEIIPLVGRSYVSGVQDCFALAKDYYKLKHNVDIPDKKRWEMWWKDGVNLINEEEWESCGFSVVEDDSLQEGDVIVMQSGSKYPDHLAIYTGNGMILHHCYKRLSSEELYIGMWVKNTMFVLRRK